MDPKAIVKALVDATKKRLNKQWMAIRDEPCDEVDKAELYLEFFKENSGDIRMVHRHDRKFGDDLLHAAGLALLIKNEYADTYLDEREPEPTDDIYNPGHRAFYVGNRRWKWYGLSGNMNFPKENTAWLKTRK